MKFLVLFCTLFLSFQSQAFDNKDPWENDITPEGGFDDGWPMAGWETISYDQWQNQGLPPYMSVENYTCDSKDFSCTCRSKRDCRNLNRDNLCVGGTQVCSEIIMGNPLFPSKIWQCSCDWKDRPKKDD